MIPVFVRKSNYLVHLINKICLNLFQEVMAAMAVVDAVMDPAAMADLVSAGEGEVDGQVLVVGQAVAVQRLRLLDQVAMGEAGDKAFNNPVSFNKKILPNTQKL
jgi:hypothetical protein